MKPMQKTFVAMISALTVTLAGYGEEPQANGGRAGGARPNKWRVSVGWVHQWGRGMSVSGPTPGVSGNSLQSFTLDGLPVLSDMPTTLTYPNNAALIPRLFDDGYVIPDLWTGDPGVPVDRQGMTWNWGVDNASQYDYDGGVHPTLTYGIDRGAHVDSASTLTGSKDSDMPTDGIEVRISRLLYSWTSDGELEDNPDAAADSILDMSLVLGLAWFPGTRQSYYRASGQEVFDVSETYVYLDYYGTGAGGSWPPLVVPYSGTYGGPGPLIPGTPEFADFILTHMGSISDNVQIKSKLWRLRGAVGIEFSKPFLSERLNVYVSPQIVLEFVDMHAKRTETVTYTGDTSGSTVLASRSDSKHKMAVYPGLLLTAGADWNFSENWYAGASIGYEWLADDPSVRAGPNKVTYDLNGGEFSLYVGYRF